jgi:hypothetical protein
MVEIPNVHRGYMAQLPHVIVLPLFFFTFTLVHKSLGIIDLLGRDWYGVRITIISCIIFGSILVTRLLYYYLPIRINYSLYVFWCLLEVIFASFFVALYVWLVLDKPMLYFETVAVILKIILLTMVFPYVIIALSLHIYDLHQKMQNQDVHSGQRMRFYDSFHNLRIVLLSQSILYIASEENYVKIYYQEGGKVKEFVLRSSMKALDELCQDNGLIRCHRSYYINPAHVKVLRKDREGLVHAELDVTDVMDIPVTKRYYDRLSELL